MHQVRAVAFERDTTFRNVRSIHVREIFAHSSQTRTRDQALSALIECLDPFLHNYQPKVVAQADVPETIIFHSLR